MVKEKNEFSRLFLLLFLFIPSISIQTTYPIWNAIFNMQASLKFVVTIYLIYSIFHPTKLKEKNLLVTGLVYLFYFLPLLLFQMFIAL